MERPGPRKLRQWDASWAVKRTALVGLGVSAPGALDSYATTFRRFIEEYPEAWGIICEAEDHLRKHEFANIRREAEGAFLRGELWASRFVPTRPWEICFILLADQEHSYWPTGVRRPIETWLARTAGPLRVFNRRN